MPDGLSTKRQWLWFVSPAITWFWNWSRRWTWITLTWSTPLPHQQPIRIQLHKRREWCRTHKRRNPARTPITEDTESQTPARVVRDQVARCGRCEENEAAQKIKAKLIWSLTKTVSIADDLLVSFCVSNAIHQSALMFSVPSDDSSCQLWLDASLFCYCFVALLKCLGVFCLFGA